MKKKNRVALKILISSAGYITAVFLGVFVMCFFSLNTQSARFNALAGEVAETVSEQGVDTSLIPSDAGRVMIYDENGELTYHYYHGEVISLDKETEADYGKYIKLLNSRGVINRFWIKNGDSEYLLNIHFVTGIRGYLENGEPVYIFLDRRQTFFANTIVIFSIYLTVFYWLVAAVILIFLDKSRKLEEARYNYIANVTHALKTPVASIKALAETLVDGVEPDTDEQKQYCELILKEAEEQSEMVRSILFLSKIQSKSIQYKKSVVEADEVLEHMLEKYSTICAHKKIQFKVNFDLYELPKLYTNISVISEIMGVILDNAAKFVGDDGVIEIDAVPEGDKRLIVSIADNGIGMSREVKSHVYERFYSGDSSKYGGNGLGLAIAKELADGLKERIWIDSAPGKGTKVSFTISLAKKNS